jgi:glycyl-tRNA synthetase
MPELMDTITSLCKRRGLVFPSSEIYGGLRSTWDYGPLGVELKRNLAAAWWRSMVQCRDDIVGLDAAILMSPQVWKASGHVKSFADPLVECRHCHNRFRLDRLEDPDACPECGHRGTFTDPRQFNLMFKTFMGPVEDEASIAYLRPETAQAMFVDFSHVQLVARRKVPFGIAQIGKSFRNEITPGNFIFRTREFEQMEMEYFCAPEDADHWYRYWLDERMRWWRDMGIQEQSLRLREHGPEELAHYAASATDIEFLYPWGFDELEGVANRTDFDLRAHQELSGQDLTYYDQEGDRRYHPYVIEPAAGLTRGVLAVLLDAYHEEEVRGEKRVVLRLDQRLAPTKVAVLPLSKNPDLLPLARLVAERLRPRWKIDYDEAGAIGRRYRRQDEVGTPLCVTIDFDSLSDNAVTVRDRDDMSQDRVPVPELEEDLAKRLPP